VRIRLIWTASCLAVLDGVEHVQALPDAWTRYGPPDALSITAPNVHAAMAAYTRANNLPPPVATAADGQPLAQFVFHSPRLGRLYWLSDDDPRDLICLLEDCGLPQAVLLTRYGQREDGIRRTRRKPAPLVSLLALQTERILTI